MAMAMNGLRILIDRRAVGRLEGGEAAPNHVPDLIQQDLAHGADFAAERQALAQQVSRGKGAAVPEFRKGQGDHGQGRKIIGQGFNLFRRLDADAKPTPFPQQSAPSLRKRLKEMITSPSGMSWSSATAVKGSSARANAPRA